MTYNNFEESKTPCQILRHMEKNHENIDISMFCQTKESENVCQSFSRVPLFETPWIVTHQVPLSLGFSRQECQRRLPFHSPGDPPDPGIEPGSPALEADSLPSKSQEKSTENAFFFNVLITVETLKDCQVSRSMFVIQARLHDRLDCS